MAWHNAPSLIHATGWVLDFWLENCRFDSKIKRSIFSAPCAQGRGHESIVFLSKLSSRMTSCRFRLVLLVIWSQGISMPIFVPFVQICGLYRDIIKQTNTHTQRQAVLLLANRKYSVIRLTNLFSVLSMYHVMSTFGIKYEVYTLTKDNYLTFAWYAE